ncbi:MAG: hypothetical protein K0R55_4593 [Sporomusa sp.]|nr:hypothetical protein [Sporomusa sp.]
MIITKITQISNNSSLTLVLILIIIIYSTFYYMIIFFIVKFYLTNIKIAFLLGTYISVYGLYQILQDAPAEAAR